MEHHQPVLNGLPCQSANSLVGDGPTALDLLPAETDLREVATALALLLAESLLRQITAS
jgi:hypothetical protein